MAVIDVPVTPDAQDLPPEVQQLILEAQRRIDTFIEARIRDPILGFVPSDFECVVRTLRTIRQSWMAPGELFLEWGSGFGVVALLAASVGFSAFGIEIEGDLVDEASALAEATAFEVPFFAGSFVPEGGEDLVPPSGEFAWLETDAPSAYDDLGLDIDDFDVIFAYPWPGEEDVVIDLFDRYAATGALLVTYQGREDVLVSRKVRPRR